VAFFFSPLSANIYFPCLPSLQTDLHTSPQLINLTITAYIVLQGVSPAFFGDLADRIGRRLVYILTFVIYVAASLGLALQRSYAALLGLRMLQSAGCSATAAIGYGVIADVAMPSERGHMLGAAMVLANLGPSFGPLLGGVLADRAGWRWVFWSLTILGAAFLLFVILAFPETARNIVGNGSVLPTRWNRPLLFLSRQSHGWKSKTNDVEGIRAEPATPRTKLGAPNPLKSLRIMFYRDAALILFMSAIFYAAYYCLQASIPNLFLNIYSFNELEIGVSYLAIGVGVALGGYSNGMSTWKHTSFYMIFADSR
jgi:multidrug resistance protein